VARGTDDRSGRRSGASSEGPLTLAPLSHCDSADVEVCHERWSSTSGAVAARCRRSAPVPMRSATRRFSGCGRTRSGGRSRGRATLCATRHRGGRRRYARPTQLGEGRGARVGICPMASPRCCGAITCESTRASRWDREMIGTQRWRLACLVSGSGASGRQRPHQAGGAARDPTSSVNAQSAAMVRTLALATTTDQPVASAVHGGSCISHLGSGASLCDGTTHVQSATNRKQMGRDPR
jgi:hypothetical protein